MFFEIFLGLSGVERTIHDFEVHFQTGGLLFEIREGQTPVSSLNLDRIALLVEVVCQVVDAPDEHGLLWRVFLELSLPNFQFFFNNPIFLKFEQLKDRFAASYSHHELNQRPIVLIRIPSEEVHVFVDDELDQVRLDLCADVFFAHLDDVLQIARC